MSTIWHPWAEPPESARFVRLRFGDGDQRDCEGFYSLARNNYFRSIAAMWRGEAVHPTHWAEIEGTAK